LCTGPGTEIEYSLQNSLGGKAPEYFKLDKDMKTVQISDTQKMKPGKTQVILVGTLKDLRAQLIINLNISPGTGKQAAKYLDPVTLEIKADIAAPKIFKSNSFANETSKPYNFNPIDIGALSFMQFWSLK
jgi:hypothetical protein